jgi:carbon-monoxide dehydrogenase medium subunit
VLRAFELHRPATVAEASALLAARPDAALYAGGTELLLLMKAGLVRPADVIDLKRIPDLGGLVDGDDALAIGATVTHRALERSALVRVRWPLVAGVAAHVANVRVRNVGTVGGNLAFADPHSDLATLFLVFDATVRLASAAGARELPMRDFVRGPYETDRRADEVLTGVWLRAWPARTIGVYVKFGLHERPTLGLALSLTLDARDRVTAARLAIGCVSPRPHRVEAAERALVGHPVGALADELAALAAEAVDPVSDLHGAADYKRELTRVFARRALGAAVARTQGRAPDRYPHAIVV